MSESCCKRAPEEKSSNPQQVQDDEKPKGGASAFEVKYDTKDPIARIDCVQFFYTPAKKKDEKIETHPILGQELWSIKRDLFLHGFSTIQKKNPSDPWSFFQIGGIHGLPYKPYDQDESTEWEKGGKTWAGGYCHHGDVLFPTWHRPYMALIERAIIKGATEYVNGLDKYVLPEAKKVAARELCAQLRLPYLDWSGSYMRTRGLPDIFINKEVTVNFPKAETFANPLVGFTAPEDIGNVLTHGYQYNPMARPSYVPPPQGATPYTPKGYGTVRYPDNSYSSNYQASQLGLMRGSNTSLLNMALAVFGTPDWPRFSNHVETQAGSEMDKKNKEEITSYGNLSSIEGVHDMVHFYLGGPGGHMGYPDIAGLDPIFFFHHCNVDRLIALWQFIYDNEYYSIRKHEVAAGKSGGEYPHPKSWIGGNFEDHDGTFTEAPGTVLTELSPLTPFRKKTNGEAGVKKDAAGKLIPDWFTSKDVRSVTWDMNITYPELELAEKKNWGPVEMLRYVTTVYRPLEDTEIRWFVNLSGIRKLSFLGPYTIRVFIGKKDATARTPLEDIHYAGFLNVFARGESVQCASCTEDTRIRGTIDVTDALIRLGRVDITDISSKFIIPEHLTEKIKHFDVEVLETDEVKLVYVAIDGTTELNPVTEDEPSIIISAQLALNKYVRGDGARVLIEEANTPCTEKRIKTATFIERRRATSKKMMPLAAREREIERKPAREEEKEAEHGGWNAYKQLYWGVQGHDDDGSKKHLGNGTWCLIGKKENLLAK